MKLCEHVIFRQEKYIRHHGPDLSKQQNDYIYSNGIILSPQLGGFCSLDSDAQAPIIARASLIPSPVTALVPWMCHFLEQKVSQGLIRQDVDSMSSCKIRPKEQLEHLMTF